MLDCYSFNCFFWAGIENIPLKIINKAPKNAIKFSYNYNILSKKKFEMINNHINKINIIPYAKFDKDDLKLLSSNPLITIGAHSHNHLSLKNLKKDDCIEEIKMSKQILEDLLNHKINHFSYPYGTLNDAGEREFEIVKKLGFKSAVTTSVGNITKKKLFNLPRIHINERTNIKILKIKLSIYYYYYKKIQEVLN